ncbi:hypothetical protein F5Y16DRAFT_404635 [Xylariaceae sp. FL0255]|nr:hypothetical protein F5Y16DRAFT_404635 [Xylariaceae sp. FL0255]
MAYETVCYGTIETSQPDGPSETGPAQAGPRRRTSSALRGACCCLFILVVIALALLVAWHLLLVNYGMSCTGLLRPSVYRHPTWTDFKNQSFHVGFDLTAGYGTASVFFDNGTIMDIGRAEGTKAYNEVLARYSLKSSARPSPPYYNCLAERADLPRQWRRYFNKKLNYPASDDVAALATVVKSLKDRTNDFLGDLGPVQVAFIVVPYLPALYNEELLDAGHAASIQMTTLPWYIYKSGDAGQWPVTELNAAYVGNGFGINGTRAPAQWPGHTHLCRSWDANFTLGSDVLQDGVFDSELYWSLVRQALRDAMDEYAPRGRDLGRVVSYGESAHDATFQKILREAVLENQEGWKEKETPVFRSNHLVYAGARGAARFGKLCTTIERPDDCFPDLTPRLPGW